VGVRGERIVKNHIGHVTALCLMESDAVPSGRYRSTFRKNLLPPSSGHSLIHHAKLQGRDMERRCRRKGGHTFTSDIRASLGTGLAQSV